MLEFHSQMLRDTFAVDMLLAGMPLEDVSRLLTHKSVRTTERYYARWVKSREKKLEEKMVEVMRRMGAKVSTPNV
jgi:integrase